MYFAPSLEGFPVELGIGTVVKKLSYGATGMRKKFDDIFNYVDTIHQRDRRTDRRTDRHRTTAKTALTHSVAW